MNVRIFNRKYWVRRFGEQRFIRGYAMADHSDFVASLNIHPVGDNQLQPLPEGERVVKRLQAEGSDVLLASNQDTGERGDLLWYHGAWYECTSAVEWDHTILSHWNYSFSLVPMDSAMTKGLEAPEGEPV